MRRRRRRNRLEVKYFVSALSKVLFLNFKYLHAIREDCQARKLNKEDAMDRCKWRKMIKEAR